MTINCNGKLIDVSSPKIMGILNITPDSFFDGGHYNDTTSILKQVEKMLLEGATFIDVGACSSRPGSMTVTEEEELKRLIQVVELLVSTFPDIILSIDTFRGKVAALALEAGAGGIIVPMVENAEQLTILRDVSLGVCLKCNCVSCKCV